MSRNISILNLIDANPACTQYKLSSKYPPINFFTKLSEAPSSQLELNIRSISNLVKQHNS